MSLLKVNGIIHSSGGANNITLDSISGVAIGNGLSSVGTIPDMAIYSNLSGHSGQNATGNQSFFSTGLSTGLSVEANTVYHFQGRLNLFKTAGTTSHIFSYSWGGTATFVNNRIVTNIMSQQSTIGYQSYGVPDRNPLYFTLESPSSVALTQAMTSSFITINLQVDGMFIPSASGTIIPQYSLSAAPGGAYTHSAGNYLSVWPVGRYTGQANLIVGSWS